MVKHEERSNSEGTEETVLAVKQKSKARVSAEQTDSARVHGDEPNQYPENWFTLLDTSFAAIDLLESPAALARRMVELSAQRSNLNMRINTLISALPDESELNKKRDAYDNAVIAYNNALADMAKTNVKLTTDTAKALLDVAGAYNPKQFEMTDASVVSRITGIPKGEVADILSKIGDIATSGLQAQTKLVNEAEILTKAALEYFRHNNMKQFANMLEPLKTQLNDINEKISDLQQQISTATIIR